MLCLSVVRIPANPIAIYAAGIGLWSIQFAGPFALENIGKNDMYMSGCVLSAFGMMIEALIEESGDNSPHRRVALLLLTTVALGLAVAFTRAASAALLAFHVSRFTLHAG